MFGGFVACAGGRIGRRIGPERRRRIGRIRCWLGPFIFGKRLGILNMSLFFDVPVHSMSLFIRCPRSFDAPIPPMPPFFQCPCSFKSPALSRPVLFRSPCSLNVLVFSMSPFFWCPCSFYVPIPPMPPFFRCPRPFDVPVPSMSRSSNALVPSMFLFLQYPRYSKTPVLLMPPFLYPRDASALSMFCSSAFKFYKSIHCSVHFIVKCIFIRSLKIICTSRNFMSISNQMR